MELHIKERLVIPTILPEKGTFMEFNLKKSISQKVSITEQDRLDYSIKTNEEKRRVEWDYQKDTETPLVVEFSKDELEYLRKSCEAISEQQLGDEVWGVVERIYNEAVQ